MNCGAGNEHEEQTNIFHGICHTKCAEPHMEHCELVIDAMGEVEGGIELEAIGTLRFSSDDFDFDERELERL